ncbi:MAG TPA: hypothetical protein VJB05_01870 [archaeon]|nr:hypothetical protein [archaeon]
MAENIEKIQIIRARDLPLKVRTSLGISSGFAEVRVSRNSPRNIEVKKIEGRLSDAFKKLLVDSGKLGKTLFETTE